jgi:hypothetical protein
MVTTSWLSSQIMKAMSYVDLFIRTPTPRQPVALRTHLLSIVFPSAPMRVPDRGVSTAGGFRGYMSQERRTREEETQRTRSPTLRRVVRLLLRSGTSSSSRSSPSSLLSSSSTSMASSGKVTSHAVGRCGHCLDIETDGVFGMRDVVNCVYLLSDQAIFVHAVA